MISSIIIEALAGRAARLTNNMTATYASRLPTVPEFRAAFIDELKRFENVELDNSAAAPLTPKPVPVRAELLSDAATQPSRGIGLGQQTGGTAQSDVDEALRILKMIGSVGWNEDDSPLDVGTRRFIGHQFARLRGCDEAYAKANYTLTGRMLFWLREAKDKLIERGIL
jgi:hypothetical protein